jgi:hypothetical protein
MGRWIAWLLVPVLCLPALPSTVAERQYGPGTPHSLGAFGLWRFDGCNNARSNWGRQV